MQGHLDDEPVDQGIWVGRAAQGGAVGQREEVAGLVPRLADPVGVEEDVLAGGERDRHQGARVGAERAQPQWQAGGAGVDAPGVRGAEQQGRGMAAVEQLDVAAGRADLGEDRGGELLVVELAGQAGLDPARDRAQAVLLVGGFPEKSQHGAAACSAGRPLPSTSPMTSRTWRGVFTTSYRSPPTRAPVEADRYQAASRTGPARRGTGRSSTPCVISAISRACDSSAPPPRRPLLARAPSAGTPASTPSVLTS